MWPFSSSSSATSPTAAASPSSFPPPPAEGPVTFHPQTGKPLTNSEAANPALNPRNPQGEKPCCACPETKKARDDCFLQFGSNQDDGNDSADKCKEIVAAHRRCMREMGFNV
ncbi:hypothetical protein JCM11251_005961 [Rhodosporidiobolus azoricus]